MDLSVLDLIPVLSGETATDALRHSVDLARFVEGVGYKRFWLAEHHDAEGLGSSAPEIMIAHVAQSTTTLRVGSGGIMLPNHATYHIAEVFRTIEALHPGRIDLGLGRAPGSGSRAALALRRGGGLGADDFPEQLEDLIKYLRDELVLKAIPVGAGMPEIWILGSSDFGARLAAKMGLPFAFAQHFSGMDAVPILNLYRRNFQPSEWLSVPRSMMGCHVICAETDAEAEDQALSSDLFSALFVQTGRPGALRSIEEAQQFGLTAEDRARLRFSFPKFVGSPETVWRGLAPFLPLVDGLMVLTMVHDQEARRNSYRLLQETLDSRKCPDQA